MDARIHHVLPVMALLAAASASNAATVSITPDTIIPFPGNQYTFTIAIGFSDEGAYSAADST